MSASPPLQIVSAWRVAPSAVMLLGRSAGPMPKAGSARIGGMPGALGIFRSDYWRTEAAYAFLAAVRLPERATLTDHAEVLMRGARAADSDLPIRLTGLTNELEFARALAGLAQQHEAAITRFLLDLFLPEVADTSRSFNALLEHFLAQAAKPDGCVELIIPIPGRVVLQGWGAHPEEPAQLVVLQPAPARLPAQVGQFDRQDVTAPDTGNVLVLPAEALGNIAGSTSIYLLAGDKLLCRNIIRPVALDAEAGLGQVRHLLPRLRCNAAVQVALRSALLPRFEGQDTLNSHSRPVRVALDQAVGAEGAGIYLAGWLFDPAAHVLNVEICTEDAVVRLDDRFVRISRPDVTDAFRATPHFPLVRSSHDWGFAVEVPIPLGAAGAYLRFTFTDDEVAFMPVRLADAGTQAARQALLASVDIHKSSGATIVEQHLAPFLARLHVPAMPARVMLEGPLERPHALVVPLASATLPRSLIASLVEDPAETDEQLILVCGSTWDHASQLRLLDLIGFYDLPASVLVTADPATPTGALQFAALLSTAEDFLLLSPDAVSPHAGWRRVLRRRAVPYDVVCPTLLYEDRAIRFAGSSRVQMLDRSPYVQERVAQAGLPAAQLRGDLPMPMTGGSFGCALFRRGALAVLASSSRFYTVSMQEAATFRILQNAGLKLGWLPMLQVIVPDGGGETGLVPRMIDGWTFRATFEEDRACAS